MKRDCPGSQAVAHATCAAEVANALVTATTKKTRAMESFLLGKTSLSPPVLLKSVKSLDIQACLFLLHFVDTTLFKNQLHIRRSTSKKIMARKRLRGRLASFSNTVFFNQGLYITFLDKTLFARLIGYSVI